MFLVKRLMNEIGNPMRIGFDHGVEDDQEFVHAGGDDDLELFALGFEALGEPGDCRIATLGGECGHVEDVSDRSPSSPDGASTLKVTAVTIEGSQPGQGADLLTVESSQFGKFSKECDGCGGPDAGSTTEHVDFTTPVVIGLEEFGKFVFDALDLAVQQVDDFLDAPANRLHGDRFATVGFGGTDLDELPAATDQLLQFGLFFRGFRGCPRSNMLSESGDDLGVDPIGLGQDAKGFGEVSDLSRVHDRHEVPRFQQLGNKASVVTSGRFDDDETSSRLRQPTVKLLQTGSIVVNRERLLIGKDAGFECALGDIDTDERSNRSIHGIVPVLQMRTRLGRRPATVPAAVRARSTKPATITLCDGLGRPRHTRSVAGRSGKTCFATLRSSFHCGVYLNDCL